MDGTAEIFGSCHHLNFKFVDNMEWHLSDQDIMSFSAADTFGPCASAGAL